MGWGGRQGKEGRGRGGGGVLRCDLCFLNGHAASHALVGSAGVGVRGGAVASLTRLVRCNKVSRRPNVIMYREGRERKREKPQHCRRWDEHFKGKENRSWDLEGGTRAGSRGWL